MLAGEYISLCFRGTLLHSTYSLYATLPFKNVYCLIDALIPLILSDVCNVSYDYSSSMDELSFVMDTSESSECLSSSGSDEQIESEMLIEPPNHVVGLETMYLSALSFSSSMSTDINLQKPHLFRSSSDKENDSQRICELTNGLGHDAHCHHKGVLSSHIFDSGESHGSITSDIEHTFTLPTKAYPQGSLCKQSFSEGYGGKSRFHPADSEKKLTKRNVGVIREGPSYFSEILANLDASMEQAENSMSTSYSYTLQWQNPAYHSNFSMNPMLTNYAFLHLMGKSGERCSTAYGQSLPYFDFSSVENPSKLCVERSPANSGCDTGSELRSPRDLHASSTSSKNDHCCNQENAGDHGLIDNMEVCNVYSPLDSKGCNEEVIESGCSDGEALFGSSGDTFNSSVQCHRQNFSSTFEIPLDFIIEKCIQQEIMLQYPFPCDNDQSFLVFFIFPFSLFHNVFGTRSNQQCHVQALLACVLAFVGGFISCWFDILFPSSIYFNL